MSQEKPPENFKRVFETIGELSKYVGAILAYLVAIFKLSPEYPYVVSITTVVLTTLFVWIWRWKQITSKHLHVTSSQLFIPESAKAMESSKNAGIFDVFRSESRNTYTLSLFRRRAEMGVLLSLTLLTTFTTLQDAPTAFQEISGFDCSYANRKNAPRVIIAKFHVYEGGETAFENNLFDEMVKQFDGDVTVCLYNRQGQDIKNSKDVDKLGDDKQGTIIIWGFSDKDYFQVNMRPIKWSGLELNWRAPRDTAIDLRNWSVEYVHQIINIDLHYQLGEIGDEIRHLRSALDDASMQSWMANDPEQLAPAYFLLAVMFGEKMEAMDALDAYNKALQYNENYDAAVLNRGLLYASQLDNFPSAINDYNHLIDKRSDFAPDAYVNRALLQTDWELKKNDLSMAIQLRPDEIYYYHVLGLDAILHGDGETASDIYRKSLPYQTSQTRAEFSADLTGILGIAPEMDNDIKEIISMLQSKDQ